MLPCCTLPQALITESFIHLCTLLLPLFIKLAYQLQVDWSWIQLDLDTVVTAFQVDDFTRTGHKYLDLLKPSTEHCVHYITTRLPRPAQQPIPETAREQRARSRSVDLDSQSHWPQSDWPLDWSIDKTAFRRSLKQFHQSTRQLRELIWQPPSAPLASLVTQADTSRSTTPVGPATPNPSEMGDAVQPQGQPLQPPVDPEILRAMRQMIREDMRSLRDELRNTFQPQQPVPPVPPVPPAPLEPRGKLRVEDLGYFDPDYESERNEAIVSVGRHVYYRDMFTWIDHLKDLVKDHDEVTLRPMVTQALRGGALIWYSTELSELEKDLLRDATMDRWYKTITERFKQKGPEAQDALDKCSYTLRDARDGRTPRAYVQDIIRHAKATGLPLYNQLLLAYTKMHFKFRIHLTEPSSTTTLSSFLEQLDAKANAFRDIARDELGGRSLQQSSQLNKGKGKQPQYFQSNNRQQDTTRQTPLRSVVPTYQSQYPTSYRYGQTPYQGYQNRPFQNYGNTQQQSPQQAQAPVPPLQAGQGQGQGYPPRLPQGAYIKQEPGARNAVPARGYNRPRDTREAFGNRPRGTAYQGAEMDEPPPEDYPDEPSRDNEGFDNEGNEEGFYGHDEEELSYYYPRDDSYESQAEAHFASPTIAKSVTCRRCQNLFPSKNLLHKHLRDDHCATTRPARKAPDASEAHAHIAHGTEIIKSSAADQSATDKVPKHILRLYHYLRGKIKLSPRAIAELVCWDTGCSVTLIDRAFLKSQLPNHTILQKDSPLVVRGIGANKHTTSEYVNLNVYIPGHHATDRRPVEAFLRRPAYVVDGLRAKMLIGMDVMTPESVDLVISKEIGYIGSCRTTFELTIAPPARPFLRRDVLLASPIRIPAHANMAVPICHVDLPAGDDFIFEPATDCPIALFASVVDSSFHAVLARNDSDVPVELPGKLQIGIVMDLDADGCYHVDDKEEAQELAVRLPKQAHYASWAGKAFASLSRLQKTSVRPSATLKPSAYAAECTKPVYTQTGLKKPSLRPSASNLNHSATNLKPFATTTSEETVLPNGVTVYGANEAKAKLSALVTEFAEIWVDRGGFVDLPQEDWMRIPLRADWESKITGKPKVYPLGVRDRAVVDKVFDKLQAQGRLEYTKQPTPFCFPVFVVRKGDEGRPVVDIRALNQVTIRDAYPLPPQSEVIGLVSGCLYVTCVDGASFFYQWRAHPEDRWKLTVVTHRGQETFNVPMMGYCNSPAYVQRQTDRLLRPFPFAKGYVDDIVIFSRTLEEHLAHLRQVFTLFRQVGVVLKPSKSFVGYPNVQLLGQRVDSFGLSTPHERLAAISKLRFPLTLAALETYLGMTGYLRTYIPWYAQIARPLQDRKTDLLKPSPKGGRERKSFSATTRINDPTKAELTAFETLQDLLSRPSYLTHFSPDKTLYIDVDASKDFGFGVVIYHDEDSQIDTKAPATSSISPAVSTKSAPTTIAYTSRGRKKIRPIMFLSRLLTTAERNYWPTELEVACLVWTVRKIRHLIESSKSKVIVFTDHSATIDIVKQSSLNSVSTLRLNLRLVRASQYLQRFDLDVRHKPGKSNVIPDALSRLSSSNESHPVQPEFAELDALQASYAYTTTLVEMSHDFKQRIVAGYETDPSWTKILTILRKQDSYRSEDVAKLPFVWGDYVESALEHPQNRTDGSQEASDNGSNRPQRPPRPTEVRAVAVKVPLRKPSEPSATASTQTGLKKPSTVPATEARAVAVRVPLRKPSDEGNAFPAATQEASEALRNQAPIEPFRDRTVTPSDASEASGRLIFHVDKSTGVKRLCIPGAVVKDVLAVAHTAEGHMGFARCYERVASSWYIRGLTRYLRDYLKHCPECLVYQTRRHAPYGSMQPIYSPPVPFHTITIDFVLALPLSTEGFDSVMSVTCKFSKRVTLAPGKTTWKALEWAVAMLERLELGDWGLPKVILSDRDPKFLSDLWTALFEKLQVKLLYSTAYHPQSDGQSERTNQTTEIMLRFFVAGLDRPELWPKTLSRLQSIMNSSISSAGSSPNEINYGFKPNQPLDLIAATSLPELKPPTARISAADALAHASMMAKHYYDRRHTPISFEEGQQVLLRLHKGYNIPANASITRKLGQQYTGPFKVLRRVGRLAYKLDVPTHWRIHPVVSVTMLEPMPGPDPYERPVPEEPDSVYVEGDTDAYKSWEVEKVLDKEGDRYLVRWKGWNSAHDAWRTKSQLANASDLVREYEDKARQARNERVQQFGLRQR